MQKNMAKVHPLKTK